MAWNILTAIDQLVKGKTMVYDYINKLIENVQYVKDNAGTGNGDMSKATYDKNDDGIVDRAAAVDDGVTGNWTTAAEIATSVNNTHLHSNKSALDLVSGINTGDQNLTGYMLKSTYDTGNDGIVDRAAAVDDGVTGNWTTAAEIANAVNHVIRTDNPHSVTKTQLSLNNVDNVQQMPLSYLDTDGTLAANSDSKVASQKATKTYYLSGEMVKSDSTGISTHYTNSTTGANANDGFLVGIDASENAIIKNQENTDLIFYTNNAEIVRFLSTYNKFVNYSQHLKADGNSIYTQYCNSDTGATATDGFIIGIGSDEKALLWNYENTDMIFYTNNTLRLTISAAGIFSITTTTASTTKDSGCLVLEGGLGLEGNLFSGGSINSVLSGLVNKADSGTIFTQYCNSTTGATGTDGFIIGIDASENAILQNFENTDMLFYTNNTLRLTISATGIFSITTTTASTTKDLGCLVLEGGLGLEGNIFSGGSINSVLSGLINKADSGTIFTQYCNSTTGATGTDGFIIGIDASENAIIKNQENTALILYTNNSERLKLENAIVTFNSISADVDFQINSDTKTAFYIDGATGSINLGYTNGLALFNIYSGYLGLSTGSELKFVDYQANDNSLDILRIKLVRLNEGSTGWDSCGWKIVRGPDGIFTNCYMQFGGGNTGGDTDILFGNSTTETMRIRTWNAAATPLLSLMGDTNTGFWHPTDDTLAISTNGTERLRINNSNDITVAGGVSRNGQSALNCKIMNIGDWNMDSTAAISVAHGLENHEKIRNIYVTIKHDTTATIYPLYKFNDAADPALMDGGIQYFDATSIRLERRTGGNFDNSNFDATSYNRGYIYIEYTS